MSSPGKITVGTGMVSFVEVNLPPHPDVPVVETEPEPEQIPVTGNPSPPPQIPGLEQFLEERKTLVTELGQVLMDREGEPVGAKQARITKWQDENKERLRMNREKAFHLKEMSIDDYPLLVGPAIQPPSSPLEPDLGGNPFRQQ